MRRVIGMDIHRTFGEVVIWDGGLRRVGRVDMTRTGLEGLGKNLLSTDEVVIEATGNCMAVSRVLSPFVRRVIIANPLQVKAIAHAHVKTDKVDAGTLASLFGREWLARQPLPDDEQGAINRHVRELDRLAEDLAILDREIAEAALEDLDIKRLMTITGVNLTVAAGILAPIGDIKRFDSPGKLVSYFGLNPRVRQFRARRAHHGRISKVGRSHARAMLVEAAWAAAKAPGPCMPSSLASALSVAIRSPPLRSRASSRFSAGTC